MIRTTAPTTSLLARPAQLRNPTILRPPPASAQTTCRDWHRLIVDKAGDALQDSIRMNLCPCIPPPAKEESSSIQLATVPYSKSFRSQKHISLHASRDSLHNVMSTIHAPITATRQSKAHTRPQRAPGSQARKALPRIAHGARDSRRGQGQVRKSAGSSKMSKSSFASERNHVRICSPPKLGYT